MHSLHKILVNIKDIKDEDRDDIIYDARMRAEERTEEYVDRAFDWRETDTAGRWSSEYPTNVMLSKDDIDGFIKELSETMFLQKENVDRDICLLSTTDIKELARIAINSYEYSMDAYRLKCVAEMLSGEYTFDSMFFNTKDYSAKVTTGLINSVRQSPDDWALVMFDYHI